MSTTIYEIVFAAGGTAEGQEIEEVMGWRQSPEDVITAYAVQYRVANDPVSENLFDTHEQADERLGDIQALYNIETQRTIISPQPEGLND